MLQKPADDKRSSLPVNSSIQSISSMPLLGWSLMWPRHRKTILTVGHQYGLSGLDSKTPRHRIASSSLLESGVCWEPSMIQAAS